MSKHMTFRELNQIIDARGWGVKSKKDFDFIASQIWDSRIDEWNYLFKMANKNRTIKRHWRAKNVVQIWKYHRIQRAGELTRRLKCN